MKNQRKLLSLLAILTMFRASAQMPLPVTNNDLRINLQKVISDFPNHFERLKGAVLVENPQTVEYAAQLEFTEAEENAITEYKSTKPIYSWKATLLTTEDFEEASKKYKWLYHQLRAMTINLDGGYSFTLNGDFEAPSESRKFSTSTFKLTPSAINMPRLKVEASMQFEFPEWKVTLLVYEKEREDRERGKRKED